MKKTLFALVALATAFAAVSCQKSDEEFAQQPINKPMVINAVAEGIGTDTKATMAYKYDILWSTGDQICVVDNNFKSAIFTINDGAGSTKGTFGYTSGSSLSTGDKVKAYYPASLYNMYTTKWPNEQTSDTVVPMCSEKTLGGTAAENFSFASLGAMLQIVFTTKQENVTLKSITIKDGTQTMSGYFTVSEGKAIITSSDKAGITLNLGDGVAVGLEAKYFNIAVPAGTYNDLTITFTTTDGNKCTLKGCANIEHNAVNRLVLSGTEFKPFGHGWATVREEACIEGNQVKWIQLWEDGPKFAEFNIGAKSITEFGSTSGWNTSTASSQWGSNWRIPTGAELGEFSAKCNHEAVANYKGTETSGVLLTGKGDYSSNSVFFPAVTSSFTRYWTSTSNGSMLYYLRISYASNEIVVQQATSSQLGNIYVRAVLDETVQE